MFWTWFWCIKHTLSSCRIISQTFSIYILFILIIIIEFF
jgi:hypothetical protein